MEGEDGENAYVAEPEGPVAAQAQALGCGGRRGKPGLSGEAQGSETGGREKKLRGRLSPKAYVRIAMAMAIAAATVTAVAMAVATETSVTRRWRWW